MPDGRPCLRPEENPPDGWHYLQDRGINPYSPAVEFSNGRPVLAIRWATYGTADQIIRYMSELGWKITLGPWHVGWSTDPTQQEASIQVLP